VSREQVAQLRVLTRQAAGLARGLLELVNAHRPQLLAETDCGALTAAIPIGRTASAERFPSEASFARMAGTAPIPCSSGQSRLRPLRLRPRGPARTARSPRAWTRGGDRQLNYALQIIAMTRARYDPATKAYIARREAEGKTKKEPAILWVRGDAAGPSSDVTQLATACSGSARP
jgi:transposase